MNSSKPRWIPTIGFSISLAILAACSAQIRPVNQTHSRPQILSEADSLKAHQNEVNRIAQNIKSIQQQIVFANKQLRADRQAMPSLNAQADSALRIAQQWKVQSAHATNSENKRASATKAQKAQAIADEKASELLVLNQTMDAIVQQTRDLQAQIKDLTTQKHTAQRLADLEAQHIKNLQAAAQSQIVGATGSPDKEMSLETPAANAGAKIKVAQHSGTRRRIASRHHHRNIHL